MADEKAYSEEELKTAVTLAVIQRDIDGIRQQHSAHTNDLKGEINSFRNEVRTEIGQIKETVTPLVAKLNQGKGAYAALILVCSALSGVLLWGVKEAFAAFTGVRTP